MLLHKAFDQLSAAAVLNMPLYYSCSGSAPSVPCLLAKYVGLRYPCHMADAHEV